MQQMKVYVGKGDVSVYLIHGFMSTNRPLFRHYGKRLAEKGYVAKAPLLKGHGGREGDFYNWVDIIWDMKECIAADASAKIIIGVSLGGMVALNLAKISHIQQVFAISAVTDPELLKYARRINNLYHRIQIPINSELFPLNISYTSEELAKIWLIHGTHDTIVPFSHFKKFTEQNQIPLDHTLVIKRGGHAIESRKKVQTHILGQISCISN